VVADVVFGVELGKVVVDDFRSVTTEDNGDDDILPFDETAEDREVETFDLVEVEVMTCPGGDVQIFAEYAFRLKQLTGSRGSARI